MLTKHYVLYVYEYDLANAPLEYSNGPHQPVMVGDNYILVVYAVQCKLHGVHNRILAPDILFVTKGVSELSSPVCHLG